MTDVKQPPQPRRAKAATVRPVLEPFLGRSCFRSMDSARSSQRLMQAAPDIMLGWEHIVTMDGQTKDFYIRQLWDAKGSAEVELMDPQALETYGKVCGWTLARAHARSGDAIAISSYVGRGKVFDGAMVSFAEAYADQNQRDYRALQDAVAGGAASPLKWVSDGVLRPPIRPPQPRAGCHCTLRFKNAASGARTLSSGVSSAVRTSRCAKPSFT